MRELRELLRYRAALVRLQTALKNQSGRSERGLLREAGFDRVQMKLVHPVALTGGIKLLTCVTLQSIADAVLRDDLATEVELRETIEELHSLARDPHTVLGGPRVFQAWGQTTDRSRA